VYLFGGVRTRIKTVSIFIITLLITSGFIVAGSEIKSTISRDMQPPIPGDLQDGAPYFDMFYRPNEPRLDLNPLTVSFSTEVTGMILQVDESLVSGYISALVGFGPRVTGTSACYAAGDYIYATFSSMDLEVKYHYWSSGSYDGNNIEATLYGEDESSDEIYVVCGHYDSVPGSPGADDNAAGTAAVMAAAKVMSQYKFQHTIRFVAFSGEEQGLYGSYYYAQEAYNSGDNIIAVLNADMIGYAETQEDRSRVKIFQDGASSWIMSYTSQVSQTYDEHVGLTIIDAGYTGNSDHASFWQFGYNAVFYHEYKFNPYYHSPQDTIDKMDMDYDMRVSRLILATLAELSEVIPGGNGGGDDIILPIVGISSPFNGEIVNETIKISGYAYDLVGGSIKWVLVKIGVQPWEYADGTSNWEYIWDTTTVLDGAILICAVSINNHGHQSGVKYVTVTVQNEEEPDEPKIPDLYAEGTLSWGDIRPGIQVSGEITVSNIGDAESLLNWEINENPEWGEWTFTPSEGFSLTPEDGTLTIQVSVIAPDEKEQSYTGEIKIINKDDPRDYEIIPVSLTTSKNKIVNRPILQIFFERFPRAYLIFKYLFF
jgi:hypothetical protein